MKLWFPEDFPSIDSCSTLRLDDDISTLQDWQNGMLLQADGRSSWKPRASKDLHILKVSKIKPSSLGPLAKASTFSDVILIFKRKYYPWTTILS